MIIWGDQLARKWAAAGLFCTPLRFGPNGHPAKGWLAYDSLAFTGFLLYASPFLGTSFKALDTMC